MKSERPTGRKSLTSIALDGAQQNRIRCRVHLDPREKTIRRALRVLEGRLRTRGPVLACPDAVRDYLRLRVADLEHEVFLALFLDAQHRLIECDELFRGTLTQTSV